MSPMQNIHSADLLSLLEQKNLPYEHRRRLIVTRTALELIEISLRAEGGKHRLSDEMKNLPTYVAAIEAMLDGKEAN